MANKEIRDGVYGYVSGTVARVFPTRNGDAYEVEVKGREEQKYADKWTVWGNLNVPVGTRVTVKGWLEARAENFEGRDGTVKAAAKRSVNKPELVAQEAGAAPAPATTETWGGGADAYGDNTPF